ncbi:chymotrypsin-2 isoform X2 [Harpegnathos saltator]|uniref:chymotrypsin-2 isoform X2 n=1 Tax=Harpegnathos saltator TaxID=610380 RepID=UPI00058D924B|nr:chymotrypsin-2 isoform X2 [Harpegnathos saltator]
MGLTSAKIFLCAAFALALCQNVLSFNNPPDFYFKKNDSVGYDIVTVIKTEHEATDVVGRTYAMEQQFPFMAVVHKLLGAGKFTQCSGSIISNRWVLTAGHCLDIHPKEYLVVFGITNKTGIKYNFYSGPGVAMITKEAFRHPQINDIDCDIGLLYMPQDIPYSKTIQPITLADGSYEKVNINGKLAAVVGWERDSLTTQSSKRLKYILSAIISNAECEKYWVIKNVHICTLAIEHDEACQGDSGGPLFIVDNNKFIQVGLISYGGLCRGTITPSVYLRISTFESWLRAQETKMQKIITFLYGTPR